jgi:hypothetical protein
VTFGASIRVDLGREIVISVPASRTRKRLLCRFNLHHKWVRRFDRDGGELYLQCIAAAKISMTSSATRESSTSAAASDHHPERVCIK